MNWIYRLFRPCDHKWEITSKEDTHSLLQHPYPRSNETEWIKTATVYHLRCKNCGDISSRKVRV